MIESLLNFVNCTGNMFLFEVDAMLLDIEGTTTSISFVYDDLFPYINQQLETYINRNWKDPNCQKAVAALKEQSDIDVKDGNIEDVVAIDADAEEDDLKKSVIENVNWQMSQNRKTSSLKLLQGFICREGYENGALTGHVYDDVKQNLEKWKSLSKKIYIYSSGSVEAQKLLFSHTKFGDLTNYFDGYFDTEIGPKIDKDSYSKISEAINTSPKNILFLTDISAEATMACEAGLQVSLVSRPGNGQLSGEIAKKYSIVNTFDDLEIK